MLAEQDAWDTFQSLPPEEKQEVVDFIARLKARHAKQEDVFQPFVLEPASSGSGEPSTSAKHEAVEASVSARPNISPLGAMKGLIICMSDDFDESLEGFADDDKSIPFPARL